ncbi:MAG: helix-turn-helix transcriptional regulator, partial [Rhodospirillales bacterium]|nr:helix-turn-helix transcriptional regulator [Rhodospirillales bacterium]
RDRAAAEAAVEQLKVYAQPQRLMILSCLLGGERRVSEIDAATGIGQPALSQQLAELRRKGLVSTRRQGTQIFYALANDRVELCVRCMEAMLGGQEAQQEQLRRATEPPGPAAPVRPAGAASFVRVLNT